MKKSSIYVVSLIVLAGLTTSAVYAAATIVPFTPPYQLQDTTNSNASRLNIDSSGNVGIGTTSPLARLQVVTPNGGNLYVSDYGCGAYGGIGANPTLTGCTNYALLTAGGDTFINRPSGSAIKFREANGEEVIIASGGNVGIGTTTPQQKLDVSGSIRLTGNIISPNDICIGTC